MHRFVLSTGSRSALRHSSLAPSVLARSVSSTTAHAAEAASPAAASSVPSIQASAAAILNANRGGRSSSASFVSFAPPSSSGGPQAKGAKKLKQRLPHANVAPLLTRIWGRNGSFKTLAPEDWANIVLNNRRRLLQMREKEQYRVWHRFQKLKKARLDWLREQGQEVSPEMRARIEHREASIMAMTSEARANVSAPIPALPLPPKRGQSWTKSPRAAAMSARALSEPQTYLKTQYPTDVWRVFSFKLTHYHSHVLHRQMEKFRELAMKLGLNPSRATYLPHKMKKFNIIRSPHADKTSREQYETRLYSLKIRISPSVDKFYAIQRLCELTFRLINGNVKMRIETPPNMPIESVTFAPNPLKAANGHTPMQQYAVRDSPGIENILYKFDQHQFPFLMDWEEEILDEKFRGIYPADKDADKPYPLEAEEIMLRKRAAAAAAAGLNPDSASPDAASPDAAAEVEEDGGVFDEAGEFSMDEADFEDDEVAEADENEGARLAVDDERNDMERMQDLYDERVVSLVKRKKRGGV